MPASDTPATGSKQHVTGLLHTRWLIPIIPRHQILHHHSIAWKDNTIVEILPTERAVEKYSAQHEVDRRQHAVLPGLINAHTHCGMTLLRGFSDDLPLHRWLSEEIWPAEGHFVNEEFVKVSTQLALAEIIRSGTTCINEMYFYPNSTADVVDKAGTRALVGLPLLEFPTMYASKPDEYLEKAASVFKKWENHPRVRTTIAPHAPYTVSDESWTKALKFAEEHDTQIHTHLHETNFEREHSAAGAGHAKHISEQLCAPIANFNRLGLLSKRLIAAHMTSINDEEVQILAQKQVNVAHCPNSNLKLGSGFCPVQKLLDHGVNVAVGTDGAASNNALDMFAELKTASVLSKTVSESATSFSAYETLYAGTLGGARALNIAHLVGSLEPGKRADFVAVDMSDISLQPIFNIVSHLVYVVTGQHVSDVWVDGKQLLQGRQLLTLNEEEIRRAVQDYSVLLQKFAEKKAAVHEHVDTPPVESV